MFCQNNLKTKIWKYLAIFCIIILAFLWLFQVIFLKSYYEWVTIKDLNKIANKITNNYEKETFLNTLDEIANDKGVCIEIISDNNTIYSSARFKGCLKTTGPDNMLNYYITEFMMSDILTQRFKVINPEHKNETIIDGIKLSNNLYAFVNTSLVPLDSTINILKNQLIIVTILVLLLAFLIAYFISNKLSKPITNISLEAKKLGTGNYNIEFDTNTNIKELNELSNTLNYATKELKQTEELRKELMANVSHDLKTPLTMIKAYAELVKDINYKNKTKREQNLNTIIEETDRLNLLVNDILDLSCIEATNNLKYETFDISILITNIISRYDIYIKDGYKFLYNNKTSYIVNADKKRLEQVIYNLINNAVNYTGKDKLIKIELIDNINSLEVQIIDTGKGINDKDLDYIWDKYYKTDKTHQRNIIGTGLGLSIVKKILINHNFSYGVNTSKKGTTFYFKIPK